MTTKGNYAKNPREKKGRIELAFQLTERGKSLLGQLGEQRFPNRIKGAVKQNIRGWAIGNSGSPGHRRPDVPGLWLV